MYESSPKGYNSDVSWNCQLPITRIRRIKNYLLTTRTFSLISKYALCTIYTRHYLHMTLLIYVLGFVIPRWLWIPMGLLLCLLYTCIKFGSGRFLAWSGRHHTYLIKWYVSSLFSLIARPIGLYFGIKDGKPKIAPQISALDNSYKIKKFPTEETIKVCCMLFYFEAGGQS